MAPMDHLHVGINEHDDFIPTQSPDDGKRTGAANSDQLVHSKLDTVLALVGSLKYDVGVLNSKLQQIEHTYLLTPEKKVEMFEKAKKQFEKMKADSDAEIEELLKRRAERGVRDGGDAVTEEDLKDLEKYEA